MRSTRISLIATALVAGLAGLAAAQPKPPEIGPAKFSMAKEYRAVQQAALKSQRKLMLSFADSMPEKLYRDRATPPQRSFSEQIHHIVSANAMIASIFLKGQPPQQASDTAAIFNTRTGLKQYINDTYDMLDRLITDQTDADRDVQVKFFGNFVPKWQVWDELNQHSMWTAGQVVANFRKNGMAPPSFLFF